MQDRGGHFRKRLAIERATPGRHFVQRRAKREQVAACIDRVAASCSGDMYDSVPSVVPGPVSAASIVRASS